MYSPGPGQMTTSPYHQQYSCFMPTSPMSVNPLTPTAQYFYQKQSPPMGMQYSPNSSAYLRNRYSRKSDEMEPMSTSPLGLSHHSPKEYLPAFLTGEVSQSSFSRAGLQHHSPKEYLPAFLTGEVSQSSFSQGFSPPSPEKRLPMTMSFADSMSRAAEKGVNVKTPSKSGPPIAGLGRGSEGSSTPFFSISSTTTTEKDLNASTGFTPSTTSTIQPFEIGAPAQNQPATTSSWVTVFGFPVTATSNVLACFGLCGTILESKSVPGSNWIHLHYSNVIEARRALQRNGTLIGGSLMVGVSPCSEDTAKEGLPPGASDFFQRGSPGSGSLSQSLNKENLEPQQPGSVSTSTFNPTPQASTSASAHAQNKLRSRMRAMGRDNLDTLVPQPKSGIVSWALDTFFGW